MFGRRQPMTTGYLPIDTQQFPRHIDLRRTWKLLEVDKNDDRSRNDYFAPSHTISSIRAQELKTTGPRLCKSNNVPLGHPPLAFAALTRCTPTCGVGQAVLPQCGTSRSQQSIGVVRIIFVVRSFTYIINIRLTSCTFPFRNFSRCTFRETLKLQGTASYEAGMPSEGETGYNLLV